MRRLLTAWVLFVAALVSWMTPRVDTYVCSMDGRARSQCCCASHGEAERSAPHAALERAGCCEIGADEAVATAVVSAPERALVAAPSAIEAPPHVWNGERVVERRVHAPRGPPHAIGPPAYLRCCVLLI